MTFVSWYLLGLLEQDFRSLNFPSFDYSRLWIKGWAGVDGCLSSRNLLYLSTYVILLTCSEVDSRTGSLRHVVLCLRTFYLSLMFWLRETGKSSAVKNIAKNI